MDIASTPERMVLTKAIARAEAYVGLHEAKAARFLVGRIGRRRSHGQGIARSNMIAGVLVVTWAGDGVANYDRWRSHGQGIAGRPSGGPQLAPVFGHFKA